MGLSEKMVEVSNNLNEIESQNNALLLFANQTTGESDTRLGEAVRRLASGYGGGGTEGVEVKILMDKNIEVDNYTNTAITTLSITADDYIPFDGVSPMVIVAMISKVGEWDNDVALFTFCTCINTNLEGASTTLWFDPCKDIFKTTSGVFSNGSNSYGIYPFTFVTSSKTLNYRLRCGGSINKVDGTYNIKLLSIKVV